VDGVSGTGRTSEGDSLRKPKIRSYTCGLAVATIALGLYSYPVREIVASLALFSVAFALLAVIAIGAWLLWSASTQLAIWTVPASRNVIARFRRLITTYERP
jgi:hypothetical protein